MSIRFVDPFPKHRRADGTAQRSTKRAAPERQTSLALSGGSGRGLDKEQRLFFSLVLEREKLNPCARMLALFERQKSEPFLCAASRSTKPTILLYLSPRCRDR